MTRLKSTTTTVTPSPKRLGAKKAKKAVKPPPEVVTKVVRRHKRGVVALRNIKKAARSTKTCIQHEPFHRLVREVSSNCLSSADGKPIRFAKKALDLIQAVMEQRLIACLKESYLLTAHRSGEMLKAKDIAQREELLDPNFPELANKIREALCESTPLLLKCEERSKKREEHKKEPENPTE
jgi:histone H3